MSRTCSRRLRRKGWQERSHAYLTGLMLDGRRKSVEPMAARLGEANDQSLGHFLANTPWDPVPVRARLARKMHNAIDPAGWVIDDTGFRKDGRMSPCVARQYTGTAGKITNCQVATTLHLASDQASCPIDWRLFMPESWDPDSDKASGDVQARRAAAGIPNDEHHRPKWQLGLECVDDALSWRVPAPPVLAADAGYGDAAAFRHGLAERGIPCAVQISHTLTVLPATATRTTPDYRGRGPQPKPRYEQQAVSVKQHILTLGRKQAKRITWRTGSQQQEGQPQMMSGRFVFARVRQADAGTRQIFKGQDRPQCRLIAEWPPGAPDPPATGCPPATAGPLHRPGPRRETTLAHRTRLPRVEDWPRPGPLRRPQMGRLAPPRHPRRRRPRLPHPATTGPESTRAGTTLYGVLRQHPRIPRPHHRHLPHLQHRLPRALPRDG